VVVVAALFLSASVPAQPRPFAFPREAAHGPDRDAVLRALGDVTASRRAFVMAAFGGDRHGMAAADSEAEAAIDILAQASPERITELPWPDRAAWLALALRERRPDWSRALLRRMPEPPPPGSPNRGWVALAQGLTALRLLEYDPEDEDASIGNASLLEVAQDALRASAGERFLLRDEAFYRLWYLAEGEGDTVEALAWADSLAAGQPRSLRTPAVRLTRARALLAAGQPGEAEAEARLTLPAGETPQLHGFLVECALAMDFPRKAARALEHLITTYGGTPFAVRAWERRLELAASDSALVLSDRERVGFLVSLLANPESGAADSLRALIDDPDRRPEARSRAAISLGRSQYRAKAYSRAEPLLRALLDDPDREIAEEARLILARILRNTGRLDAMAREYAAILDAGGPQASRALWEWAREAESQNAWSEAESLYSRYIERFPRTVRHRDALFRRGFDRVRLGKAKEAAADFRAALEASRSRPEEEQAAFWLARTLIALGKETEARDAARAGMTAPEPADGYGVLLRTRFTPPEPSGAERDPTPAPDAAGLFDAIDPAEWPEPVRGHYERGLALVELGQADPARQEWGRAADLGRRYPSLLQSLALTAAAFNVYPEGVRWAAQSEKTLPPGHPHRPGYERLAYPAAYYRLVAGEATKHGVNPWALWALMRQESFYDPQAVSRAGALGLMQVMPATLQRIVTESGTPGVAADALFVPRVNIATGTRFFSDRLDEFSRQLVPTLASYNAGETKSWEWLRRADGDVEEIFIETIGYPETHDYVRRILWLTWVYEAYYGAGRTAPANGSKAR
jgi:soluble lytic murein transglycosylase